MTVHRWRWARRSGTGLAALLSVALAWGALVEPRLIDTTHEVAMIPNLPPRWEGQQVAMIADLQVGMWGANTGTVRRIVRRLVDRPPAAVLIAGDFLYKADDDLAAHIAEVVSLVQPLAAAGIPTFAVLGNHDYSMDEREDTRDAAMAERLAVALARAGIRVLQNEAVALTRARDSADVRRAVTATDVSEALYIVGLGSRWAQADDAVAALSAVPPDAPRLVLMHNPESFEHLPAGSAPVALAAHTHGGQMRLPFTPSWSWLTFVQSDAVHADGWIRDADFGASGNTLYVNRGIGFSDVPVRINCPPELTMLLLRRAGRGGG